ncbi:hypothetical protein [Actinoplanes aureus]|uniref:Uncharacterized protein n=1 Tax=Actinoplanes aureus TaxID=2792083 RepID=A0A931CK21_9ACTN|nr:hypothetical protein [Actinoplanes aureus]MBG0568793.1 hypothetical protein [Actinoplanes aureus]
MPKHESAESQPTRLRRAARHALHPVSHVTSLVTLHAAALLVIEKTPVHSLLAMLH